MSLREWLDAQVPAEEIVVVRGKEFLVVEIDLAERSELFAKFDGKLTDETVEGLLLCRCVLDPATRQPLVPLEEYAYWRSKPTSFAKLLGAALRLNGMTVDPVQAALKNSDATTG